MAWLIVCLTMSEICTLVLIAVRLQGWRRNGGSISFNKKSTPTDLEQRRINTTLLMVCYVFPTFQKPGIIVWLSKWLWRALRRGPV
ncbi:hypothetical protein F5X99DRAFT_390387 [Biscogniauxia marginata]|nr:hypothetical protein F5X99DRAFT_390387 [Biscogniauxia marginata]